MRQSARLSAGTAPCEISGGCADIGRPSEIFRCAMLAAMDEFDGPKPTPSKKQLTQMAAKVFSQWARVLNPDADVRELGTGDAAELAGARGWNVVHRHSPAHVFALEGEATLWAVGPGEGGRVVAVQLESA